MFERPMETPQPIEEENVQLERGDIEKQKPSFAEHAQALKPNNDGYKHDIRAEDPSWLREEKLRRAMNNHESPPFRKE